MTGTARPHIRAPSQHGSVCRVTTLEARSQPLRRTGRPAAPPTRAEGSPGRPLRRGSVIGTGTCFLPSRSSSSWNPELTLEVATNQRAEPHAQTAPPQTCTPTSALGHLLARPCGWRGRAGGRRSARCARRGTHSQRCTPPGRAVRLRLLPREGWGQDCRPGLCGPAWRGDDPGPPPSKAADRREHGHTQLDSRHASTLQGTHTRALPSWLSL